MTRIVLDEPTLAKLKLVRAAAELCDADGNVVGRFTPAASEGQEMQLPPPLSREEWDRRMKEPQFTTSQVLERLKGLECSR